MEKTAKRIGIALLAVLLVALLCAGIALALPQAETPLASADGSSSLDTSVRSVTVGDRVYDLSNWQDANDYYQSLIDQGYTEITDQTSLQKFLNDNGGNSGAKGAMKPYSNTGSPITYTLGQHSTTDFGANMGVDGVFKATLDGCGANVTLKVNHEWNGTHSKQSSGSDALTHAGITSEASYFKQVTGLSLTGTLANSASGATVKNLNMNISEAEEVINGAKDNGVFVGGLFGAMYNTTIDNCSLNITAAITGTKTGTKSHESAGENTFAFGGIAAYALGSTISNFSLNLGAEINIVTNGKPSSWDSWGDGGNPRGAAGGAIAISQDVSMYNIVLTGSANVRSYIDDHWIAGNSHITRAGALVGISISPNNAEALTFGATSSSSGVTAINGVLTNYTGTAQWCSPSGSSHNDGSGQYVLIGSSEGGAITNLYWNGDTAPSASFAGNSSYTATAVNATADKGTAQISFKNETGAVSSLSGLQVTYTAPPDSGSILWSYTDSGAPGEGLDMYSAQPYETYTIQWPRTLTAARNVTFTTGRKVKYTVQYTMTGGGDTNITDQGGMDADPVDTKKFDNKAFASPVLRVSAIDGSSLGDITDQSYWSISKGELTSSWTTAVDVGTYNVRLIDAFKDDTAYDFIDADQKFIAYKSDNSNGASRNYVFKITQRELSLSITEPQFVYDNQTKSLEFVLNTIADGDDTPSVIATYFDKNQSQIDASQVIGAGDYYVTVTGVNDSNYYVNADDLTEHTMWKFTVAQKKITITPSGYEDLVYNGAPQYPTVEIGNRISENDNQVVTLNYYGSADPNRPLNIDERINVDSYKMIARLSDPANYVLDNSGLTASETVSFDDSSVTISYNIAKADLKFVGETTISFVYSRSVVRTLQALNTQAGTSYYFQPVDENNTADKDIGSVGSDVLFNIIDGPATNNVSNVGTYTIKLSYESDNFNAISQTITAEVTQKPLTLNFNEPYETQFVYGEQPNYTFDAAATGAISADAVVFDIVYYVNDGDGTVKLDYVPKNAGSYIAAIEVVGAATEAALGNYYVDDSGNSKIAYTITKKDITVAYDGNMSFTYDGTAHSDVSVTSVEGIIASEQDLYNADTLKVTYTKDGSTADTARNAGEYTLGAAPKDAEDTDFANNYNVATAQTFTVEQAPLTIELQEYSASYADTVGTIPYIEGEGGTYIVTAGEIFGDDRTDAEGDNLFVVTITDGPITELRDYTFTMKLNADNSNAANYDLTVNGSGVIHVEGTPVFAGVYVYDESGEIVGSGFADESAEGAYDITVPVVYGAQPYRAEFGTRTTAGSIEGISFDDPSSVTGGATSGKSDNGYPYISARNAGTYTAVFTLAADAQGKFYFPGEGEDSAYSIKVTFVIDELEVTVAPNDVTKTYGDDFADDGWYVEGDADGALKAMLEADGFVPVITANDAGATASVGTLEGGVSMTYGFGETGNAINYIVTAQTADVTIAHRPVTVSLNMSSGTAVYGDPLPTATSVTGDFVGEDASEMTALINEQLVYDRNAGVDKVPTLANSAIGNYTVTLADGTGKITITPKQISGVSVTSGKMPYGGSAENITPVDGVYFTGNPGFLEEDLGKLGLAFTYTGDQSLSALEPGDYDGALQLTITDEVMKGNYQITGYAAEGTLTVEAMIINKENVEVTLDENTYNGSAIDYTVSIGGVTVQANDRLDITINGSRDTQIKDAGEYVFEINGGGDYYKGNVTVTVTVKQADISGMGFGLNKDSATYTGSVIDVKANTTIVVSLAVTQDGKEAQLINAGTYTVTVTPTDPNYTGSKTFTFTIDKAPHKAPVQTELTIEVAWNSVTVTHDEFTVQLSKDGTDWVDTTMEGYDANSSYTLHVRFKEDANHSESSNTIMISGKTAERTAVEFTITDKEEHYNRVVLTITFEEAFSGKVQFSIDGGKTWKDLTVQDGKYVASGLAESSEYTLQVKIPAGDDYLESDPQPVKVKTGIDPAKYTETLAMFGETFSAGDLVNYETLKEQFNGLTEADKAGVDAAKFATITAARDAFVASVNSDIEDIQNVAAKTAGRAVAAAAAAVTAAAIALFIAKRKFI